MTARSAASAETGTDLASVPVVMQPGRGRDEGRLRLA